MKPLKILIIPFMFFGIIYHLKVSNQMTSPAQNLDNAVLAIVKNQPEGLENYLKQQGQWSDHFPSNQQVQTLLDLAIQFERWEMIARFSSPKTRFSQAQRQRLLSFKPQTKVWEKLIKIDPSLEVLAKQEKLAQIPAEVFETKPALPKMKVAMLESQKTPNFYRKRQVPQEKLADRSQLIEPSVRPRESYETSDLSEFSD